MTDPRSPRSRPEVWTPGVPSERPAWIERVTSGDHKSVGLLYIGTALALAAVAAIQLLLMRVQLIVPESTLIAPEIFNQLLTVGGTTALVLVAVPLALGLLSYLAPLQIGARGVALPGINLLSYWLYAAGVVTLYATFLYTPPAVGPMGMAPLAEAAFEISNGGDAWIAAVGLATAGFVLHAINLVATLGRMRAPGLAWRRVPPLAWAGAAASWLMIVIGPVMLAGLTMLFIDRNFGGVFFAAGDGGAPLLHEHIATIYFTGLVTIAVVVAAGIVSEILPTLSGRPLFSRPAAVASMVAIAVLAPAAWMASMYEAPLGIAWKIGAMTLALALIVPIGVLMVVWIATLWNGAVRLRAGMLYALAAISTLAFGLSLHLAMTVIPVGWMLDNTTAALAATTYVIVGATALGGFAALHHWFAKLSGRQLGEGLGRGALVAILLGLHVYAISMLIAGVQGQPAAAFQYFEGEGLSALNLVGSLGAFVLVAGLLAQLSNVVWSYGNGRRAGHDPWGGTTLEWFALSPPPPHNFDVVPDVRSAEPMVDIRIAVAERTAAFSAPRPLDRPAAAERASGASGEADSRGTPVA